MASRVRSRSPVDADARTDQQRLRASRFGSSSHGAFFVGRSGIGGELDERTRPQPERQQGALTRQSDLGGRNDVSPRRFDPVLCHGHREKPADQPCGQLRRRLPGRYGEPVVSIRRYESFATRGRHAPSSSTRAASIGLTGEGARRGWPGAPETIDTNRSATHAVTIATRRRRRHNGVVRPAEIEGIPARASAVDGIGALQPIAKSLRPSPPSGLRTLAARDAAGTGGRAFPERDLEQADASDSVERASGATAGSREGATCPWPASTAAAWSATRSGAWRGRMQLERGLPACGSGARRECPPRRRASTPGRLTPEVVRPDAPPATPRRQARRFPARGAYRQTSLTMVVMTSRSRRGRQETP